MVENGLLQGTKYGTKTLLYPFLAVAQALSTTHSNMWLIDFEIFFTPNKISPKFPPIINFG